MEKGKKNGSKRSRVCVAAFNDKRHSLCTAAPTTHRISLRLILCLAAIFEHQISVLDVTQSFTHFETNLQRPVFARPPKHMILRGMAVKVVKPLYGLPESPLHWLFTYLSHRRNNMGTYQLPTDPCLLMKDESKRLHGIVGLQVNDTIVFGKKSFLDLKEKKAIAFPSTGRKGIRESPET